MNVNIIKLKIEGDVLEQSVYTKKNEKFNIKDFKNKINDEESYSVLKEWDIDSLDFNYKDYKLLLIGSDSEQLEEHEIFIHPLPINGEYEFYGDLYVILLKNNSYINLSVENYEEINNKIYFKLDGTYSDLDEEEEYSDEEVESNNDVDDDNFMSDYGDDINDDEEDYLSESESQIDEDEKKNKKKKKKIIKVVEHKDILSVESSNNDNKKELRNKILNIIKSIFEPKNTKLENYLDNLEREIYNYCIEKCIEKNVVPTWNQIFINLYINKTRSLYSNLSPNNYINNKRLKSRLQKYEFTPKDLVNMTHQELFPEHWKELIDEKSNRDKALYETKKEAMTDQFKCRKCGSRETCYYEMQTRSADEPMTIFITCLNCGNRWKR